MRRLYLRYNAIDSFEEVRKLKDLPKLTSLSLIGNPVCSEPDYRYENFSNMSLNFHKKHRKVFTENEKSEEGAVLIFMFLLG